MAHYGRARELNKSEFFNINSLNFSQERLSEELYIIIHTAYLFDVDNYKSEIIRRWKEKFNMPISEDSFEYLRKNFAELIRPTVINRIKSAEVITSARYLTRALVGLEFDLWLIGQLRESGDFTVKEFEKYLTDKYGDYLYDALRRFKNYDLAYGKNFKHIARALEPHGEKIKKVFVNLLDANKSFIQFADKSAEGTVKKTIEKNDVSETVTKKSANSKLSTEYELILSDLKEKNLKLEKDIKEFKRQRDELRDYSVKQYDKGVMALFSLMNDKRYGKIIDYFYSQLKDDSTNEILASYLENLFMLFEDMEIEPIISGQHNVEVDESRLSKDYNLEFDKQNFIKGQEVVKYVGWKYKDYIIEKPTLKIKEE